MSQQNIAVLTLTLTTSGDVTANRAVGFDGAQATVQGQKVMGASVTDAASGNPLALITSGTAILESGAAIAVGDSLVADSQGRVIPASALTVAAGVTPVISSGANGALLIGGDLPEFILADALQSASASGEMIEVLLRR
ncbi:MAG: DUF2190 family protein [Magnetococcales bacterium]|nr:DUF2190 family protein [Magnetococcales bacterium]